MGYRNTKILNIMFIITYRLIIKYDKITFKNYLLIPCERIFL